MKRLSITSAFLVVLCAANSAHLFAQAPTPRLISFQGVLVDASGTFIPDGPHSLALKVYDALTGGTVVFSETQTVPVVRGVFNVLIGASVPAGIPPTVLFDRGYWLGVSVDGATELQPRTVMAAVPYSLHSWMAEHADSAGTALAAIRAASAGRSDSAGNLIGGAVISVNGQQGAIQLAGAAGTTITRSGNTLTISARDTTGVQYIKDADNTMAITNPAGPITTIDVANNGIRSEHIRDGAVITPKILDQAVTTAKILDGGVTTAKLADLNVVNQKIGPNAVDATKINTGNTANGNALLSNGTVTPIWANPILYNIPFAAVVSSASTLWSMTNIGTGGAGTFNISNPASAGNALTAASNGSGATETVLNTGTGGAASFAVSNTTSTGTVLSATTNGTGGAANFSETNVLDAIPTVAASTAGIGAAGSFANTNSANTAGALQASTNGVGPAGQFIVNNAASINSAVTANSNGSGAALAAVNTGAGMAGSFNATSSFGLQAFGSTSTAGVLGSAGSTASYIANSGVAGSSSTGTGVSGVSLTTGTAVIGLNVGTAGNAATFQVSGSTNASPALNVLTFGTGSTGVFTTSNTANASTTLLATTSGTGRVGSFTNSNSANINNTLEATTNGGGASISGIQTGAGKGENILINNSANASSALDVSTNGTGSAVSATANGTGRAGLFTIGTAGNSQNGVQVNNAGSGNGISVQMTNAANGARGVDVLQPGVGPGVYATSTGGTGVWGITSSISAAGVIGDNTFGEAVVGRNRGGNGVGAVVGRNDSSGYGVRGFNTQNGFGVLGQAGISGGTGVAGRFENINAASGNDAVQAATNGTGWAGNFSNSGAGLGSKGIVVTTTPNSGGPALKLANGALVMSSQNPYASAGTVDDAFLVVTGTASVTLPTSGIADGTTVWVINANPANGPLTIANTTNATASFIANGTGGQFVFLSAVSGANWVPLRNTTFAP